MISKPLLLRVHLTSMNMNNSCHCPLQIFFFTINTISNPKIFRSEAYLPTYIPIRVLGLLGS